MNAKLHTFAVGVKAEIEALNSGKGAGKGAGSEGKGSKGGIDKKEVAVWKLLEDVTKVQYRHWPNAVNIHLEAVHGWSCFDYILNCVKRCPDSMNAEIFGRCLAEVSVYISSDPDVEQLSPDPSEYPYAERA